MFLYVSEEIPNDPGKMFIGGLSWQTTPEVSGNWNFPSLFWYIGRVTDPDLTGWIRKIFTGSGSFWYFGNVKLYNQEKNI